MTELAQVLAGFAAAFPAGPEWDEMRALGRASGYPSCCVAFYVAVIPLVWSRIPEAEAYWAGAVGRGYVPCPECLGGRGVIAGDDRLRRHAEDDLPALWRAAPLLRSAGDCGRGAGSRP